MSLKIIRSTDAIAVEHPVITVFGQPGICKTSLGYSAKDPLLLDSDDGAHRAANRRDTLPIHAWSDVEQITPDMLAPYSTIVADTVGRFLDLMTVSIIEQTPKYGRDGSLTLQGYGVLKARFRTWLTQLRALGKDVVLIAHAKEDKDGDNMIVRPDITGASYGEVMKVSDLVGYVYMAGKNRVLDFNPTDRWVGKNPGQWKPLQIPPVEKATETLAKLIEDARKALGAISQASAQVAAQVEAWKTKIAAFTKVEEFNSAIPEIRKLTPVQNVQVKKLLMDRAKESNISFDAEKVLFFIAPPTLATEPVAAGF